MKKQLYFALSLYFFALSQLSAAILVVNNINGSTGSLPPGQFTNVTAALVAANPGDVILVKGNGSGFTYGAFTINKSVTIIGSGHKPAGDATQETYCDGITVAANTDNVVIRSMNIGTILAGGADVDGLLVENCRVRSTFSNQGQGAADGWLIKNNVLVGQLNLSAVTGAIVSHNIFHSVLDGGGNNSLSMIITNNIFLLNGGTPNLRTITGAVVSNNIFYGHAPIAQNDVSNCVFSKNISDPANGGVTANNDLPPVGGGGNTGSGQNLVAQDPLFVSVAAVPALNNIHNFAYSSNYRLQAGSPGHNFAADGTDIGCYGAGNTFSETGEPPLPVVQSLDILNLTLPSGGTLNVNFNVRNAQSDSN